MRYHDYIEEQARVQEAEDAWARRERFEPLYRPKTTRDELAQEMGVPPGWIGGQDDE